MAPAATSNDDDDKLRVFYELLILLRILGPCVGSRTQGSSRNNQIDESSYTPLRRFLDRLCWMCDGEPGGETVTSIGIEQRKEGVAFWMTTSYEVTPQIETHLVKLLNWLALARDPSARVSNQLEQTLSRECIRFAHKRVELYSRCLTELFAKYKNTIMTLDGLLAQDILHLIRFIGQPEQLCAHADFFRDSESLTRLSRLVASVPAPSQWSMLRHYIGRLGSWHRAARTLVEFASTRPELFVNFHLQSIPTPKPIRVPRADENTSLMNVLYKLFTPVERVQIRQGISNLERLHRIDLSSKFRDSYFKKNFKARVHAEVWLLEHFRQNNLSFLNDDRYLGCSKPSCYCCSLYLSYRPGGPIQRPSHGNVWPNWQSPLTHDGNLKLIHAGLRDQMILKMREDFRVEIAKLAAYGKHVPDTTTGFTIAEP